MTALDRARRSYIEARSGSDAATPGGLHGDPATLSGVRRTGGQRADARRFAAYDREAAAAKTLAEAEADAQREAAAAERAARDAAAPCDLDTLRPGDAVRDRHGWHRVVRVNAKSVTVATGYSWDDRIPHSKVVETRQAVTS